ncbi:MAG: phosphoribosyl transferase [Bacilli bacterium]|nr:phosphoribosyl transferase [Bacilli bacterium]
MYNTYRITPNTLNYKTYEDLSLDIKKNLYKLPSDIDLVVGVPRSGMIPAYMLGLMLSKQVCSLREFISGDYKTLATHRIRLNTDIKNILIVDDSINSGKASLDVKHVIEESKLNQKFNITYMAVYYRDDNYKQFIDIALEKVLSPRLFQWNYLNHCFLQDAAFDIDGVLCIDPTNEENDDGPKYKNFLLNAKPLFIPQYKIPYIITSRLEQYRPETEEWLKKNNVQYDNLIMLKGYTAEERRKLNLHAKFKAEQYKKLSDIQLFIESDRKQAQEIAKLTKKICFCASTDELFNN